MKDVHDLGKWEQTTLKEARPDWKDPDTVELPSLGAQLGDKKGAAAAKGAPPPKKK
jgi:hypothetical protein